VTSRATPAATSRSSASAAAGREHSSDSASAGIVVTNRTRNVVERASRGDRGAPQPVQSHRLVGQPADQRLDALPHPARAPRHRREPEALPRRCIARAPGRERDLPLVGRDVGEGEQSHMVSATAGAERQRGDRFAQRGIGTPRRGIERTGEHGAFCPDLTPDRFQPGPFGVG
jgi:hypothetical protein